MNEQNTSEDGAKIDLSWISGGVREHPPTATTVWVRFTVEDWHNWPDAPVYRAYLRHPHRHLFHVEVEAVVRHDNRDIEFHDLLQAAKQAWPGDPGEVDVLPWSCERFATHVGTMLHHLDLPVVRVSVSEDNEVGATVRWTL